MPAPPEDLVAALPDRYALERELGRGGMAVVFLALDRETKQLVAVKVLLPELVATLASERFAREIQIALRLDHRNLLSIHDWGQSNGFLYYVMPYVKGESLRERLAREGQLPLEDAVRIARQVGAALGHAHSENVVHRDIKPGNILLTEEKAVLADFGVAQAVTEAGGGRLTATGLVVGTAKYMSPEQASGNKDLVDPRSDLYSLGCVLYEMLCGKPPFDGPDDVVMRQHVTQPPPSLRPYRPDLPPHIERSVTISLSKAPADRFPSAAVFNKALIMPRVTEEWATRKDVSPTPEQTWRGRVQAAFRERPGWIAVGAMLVVVTVVVAIVQRDRVQADVNPSMYVIGALSGDAPAADDEADLWRHHIDGFLRAIPQIQLPGVVRENDARMRGDGDPSNLRGWLNLTESLGAGRLIMLAARSLGDSMEIIAEEYDVRTGRRTERAASVRVPAGSAEIRGPAAALVEQLFERPPGTLARSGSSTAAASRAFFAGTDAFRDFWDLPLAERGFRRALELDPEYGRAAYWLAQVKAWAGQPELDWVGFARDATSKLDPVAERREKALARALLALGERRFVQACEVYDSLVKASPQDFRAQFGLGDCHASDPVVVADPASPSGFSYRGSYQAAVEAYQRALEEIAPGFSFAFGRGATARLERILYTGTNAIRRGHAEAPDTTRFGAFPSFIGDTLAFVPWPLRQAAAADSPAVPVASREAVASNRERLRVVVSAWQRAYPGRPEPNVALARVLEVEHTLDAPGSGASALRSAREAQGFSLSAEDSLEAEIVLVRVLLKLGRFFEAKDRASTTLQRWKDDTDPVQPKSLAGLAALLGQPHLTARLSRLAVSAGAASLHIPLADLPQPLLEAQQTLFAYAAVGAPADSLIAGERRLGSLMRIHASPTQLEEVACELYWSTVSFAFPTLRRATDRIECWFGALPEMQAALGVSASAVSEAADRWEARRRGDLPGELSIDHAFHEAWVLKEAGDSARAIARLDRSLEALPTLGTALLSEASQAAGLVRAMALRARLAAAAGDPDVARRWARPVLTLWGDAEVTELADLLEELRALVEGQSL